MARSMTVIATANPPGDEQLKAEHAAVVHSLYEAAEIIADQWLISESLSDLGVQVVFEPWTMHRVRVDEIYYRLLTKKPVFASDLPKAVIGPSATQLSLQF